MATQRVFLAVLTAGALSACAAYAQAPAQARGGVLADEYGNTLYTYDQDTAGSGKSACYDQCAVNWPPFKAEAGKSASGDWTIITRSDGSKQWAHKGKPLYFFKGDAKAGDQKGDKLKGVWHVIKS